MIVDHGLRMFCRNLMDYRRGDETAHFRKLAFTGRGRRGWLAGCMKTMTVRGVEVMVGLVRLRESLFGRVVSEQFGAHFQVDGMSIEPQIFDPDSCWNDGRMTAVLRLRGG